MLADSFGRPLRFLLAAGQSHDIPAAPMLLQGYTAEAVLADRAYGPNAVRSLIAESSAKAVVPATRSRSEPIPHDPLIYRCRNRIERCFNKLKHFRRFAMRYDRRATSSPSFTSPLHADIDIFEIGDASK